MTSADTATLTEPAAGHRTLSRLGEIGPVAAGIVVPFSLTLYLGLQGGGYDAVLRSEVGIAIWWFILIGAAVGVVPAAKPGRAAWLAVAGLAAFGAWTALGLAWSESQERTVAEIARVAMLLGVFVFAVFTQPRGGLRRTVGAVATALTVLGMVALLSRLQPSWFGPDETSAVLESARARLSFPLDYWNGLAALMAIAVPLLLAVAIHARHLVSRALATAAVPAVALVAFYTLSRGGAVELSAAVVAFIALSPRRLQALPTILLAAGGSAIVIAAATQRDALEDGLHGPAALSQGDEMTALLVVACAGVALLRIALSLAETHELIPRPEPSRRATWAVAASTAAAIALAAVALGAPGELSDRWQEFKRPAPPEQGEDVARFASASGSYRYQYWEAAADANATDPALGIGPGTFEYYWARDGSVPGFVRDAHSLYLETLAEAGIVGLLLIGGFVAGVLALGIRRATGTDVLSRPWFAAATAGCVAFAVAAALDWAWELTVIPVAFLLLAGAIVAGGDPRAAGLTTGRGRSRVALAGLAVVALAAIAIPLAGESSVRASQESVRAQELGPALGKARDAAAIEPWAARPELQEALVLELRGDLDGAARAARAATRDEPTNWRTWFVLSRVEAYLGNAGASVDAYRRARELNPRSPLFAQ